MKMFLTGASLSLAAFAAVPATAQQVVNLGAIDTSQPGDVPSPVTLPFDAGTYNVQVVGTAGGGLYNAWTPATPAAGNYDDRYSITANGTTNTVNPYNGQRFATATDALDAFAGIVTSFTLASAGDVTFSIPDYLWSDNTGGVSLQVSPASGTPTPVPEPATMGLFGLGAAALLARARRKAKIANA